MRNFEHEIEQQYPDWFEGKENDPQEPNKKNIYTVRLRQPGYVLPMLLTLILLVCGGLVIFTKSYENDRKIVHAVTKKFENIDVKFEKHEKKIHLLGVLHNENFAAVRNATGNRNIIFINRDWTINTMPRHLTLTKAEWDLIKSKHLTPYRLQAVKPYRCD